MLRYLSLLASFLLGLAFFQSPAHAEKPLTLETVEPSGKNTADEPLAKNFSVAAAKQFLDTSSLHWQKTRKCFTCHTNYLYLVARPAISAEAPEHKIVRAGLEEQVEKRWTEKGPRWDAEVVMSAAILALNDKATTGKLHPTTRKALDRMWTLQREDGGFKWLKCNWPPMELDDHYGATIAAIGAGAAPEGYAQTEAAKKGLEKLREYLKNNPPPTLHHQAMILWASAYADDIAAQSDNAATIKQLLAKQNADGGWGLADLGDWKRADDKPQVLKTSDGYGTGFVIYVLRRAGVKADNPQIQKGVAWLKANQRESGRWYTRSMNKDNKHFITHAGTAFAVLALGECGELKE